MWLDLLVIFVLIIGEGLFAGAEMALVTLRPSQVDAMAARGPRGRSVKRLREDPNQYLSAVQIGVTLTALLASAFGAITVTKSAGDELQRLGLPEAEARWLAFLVVTLSITFLTLVIGELAPKRLATQWPERTAWLLGPPLRVMASAGRPVIWLLSRSTNAVVRLLGGDPHTAQSQITEAELRDIIAAHEMLSGEEHALIDDVFAASDRRVREVMVPRTRVDFLRADQRISEAAHHVAALNHWRYPVIDHTVDEVIGVVTLRDILNPLRADNAHTVADLVRDVMLLPGSRHVLNALADMRHSGQHLAIVIDEYGGTAGIITLEDLVEEVVGDIRGEHDAIRGAAATDGPGIEISGLLNRAELQNRTGIQLPDGPFETVGGYVMARLGRLPAAGDAITRDGRRLEVLKMDRHRIEALRITMQHDCGPSPAPRQTT